MTVVGSLRYIGWRYRLKKIKVQCKPNQTHAHRSAIVLHPLLYFWFVCRINNCASMIPFLDCANGESQQTIMVVCSHSRFGINLAASVWSSLAKHAGYRDTQILEPWWHGPDLQPGTSTITCLVWFSHLSLKTTEARDVGPVTYTRVQVPRQKTVVISQTRLHSTGGFDCFLYHRRINTRITDVLVEQPRLLWSLPLDQS